LKKANIARIDSGIESPSIPDRIMHLFYCQKLAKWILYILMVRMPTTRNAIPNRRNISALIKISWLW